MLNINIDPDALQMANQSLGIEIVQNLDIDIERGPVPELQSQSRSAHQHTVKPVRSRRHFRQHRKDAWFCLFPTHLFRFPLGTAKRLLFSLPRGCPGIPDRGAVSGELPGADSPTPTSPRTGTSLIPSERARGRRYTPSAWTPAGTTGRVPTRTATRTAVAHDHHQRRAVCSGAPASPRVPPGEFPATAWLAYCRNTNGPLSPLP